MKKPTEESLLAEVEKLKEGCDILKEHMKVVWGEGFKGLTVDHVWEALEVVESIIKF